MLFLHKHFLITIFFLYSSSLDSPHLSSNNVTGISGMPAPGAPSPSITSKNTETTSIASSSTTGHNEPMGYIQSQSYQSSAGSGPREIEGDSDFEAERDPPDWRPKMSQDELARLKPKEKKRQDVINGKTNKRFICHMYMISINMPS